MNHTKLVLLGVLAAGLTVTGCTTHMARNDATNPPADTTAPAADVAQADAAPSADNAPPSGAAAAPAAEGSLPAPMADAGAAPAAPPAATDAAAAPASTDTAAPPAQANAAAPAAATEKDAKQAVALLPLPAAEITDTIKKLTHHPRVRYLSRTAQYDYYVGGRLDAKYDLNSNQLIVTGANETDPVKCEYGQDGAMISDGKVPPKTIGECNALVNELGGYLSH